MSWGIRVVIFLVLLYPAFLFYVPVPDDINEKFQYRFVSALVKFASHLVDVSRAVSGTLGQVMVIRKTFDIARKYFLPSGERYGPEVQLTVEMFDGVKVHVYNPPGPSSHDKHLAKLPAFIFIHGGGLGIFDAEHYDGLTRKMCMELTAVVISIEYRRTPESVFPIPFEDTLKATKWFLLHANDHNVDVGRVAIGGDSAGGYLSVTVSQVINSDVTLPNIKLQVLLYPWLQVLDFYTPSCQKYRHVIGSNGVTSPGWIALFTAAHIYGIDANDTVLETFLRNDHVSVDFKTSALYKERFAHSLVPIEYRDTRYYEPPQIPSPQSDVGRKIWEESKEKFMDPRLSPFLIENFSGTPITYVVTVEYDCLRDDGIMFAKILERAGVDVTWRHYDTAFHGIIWVAPGIDFKDGTAIMNEVYAFVRSKL